MKERLEIKKFSDNSIIVVYNPQENVLLLIRKAERQDLTSSIETGLDDLKMFILLFNDELKNSKKKLITLVVTDKAHEIKLECADCINNVLSLEEFEDLPHFEKWWKERETYFEKVNLKNISPISIKNFLAKITGTVAATFVYGKYVPTLTDKYEEQMENVTVLLTRKQMEIMYSQDKHIIIRGGFGCGKTIIAAAMLKKISESLKTDEKLYYICYDSRSELLDQMLNVPQKEKVANMTPFHNKERRNFSEIIKDILDKKKRKRKVNFIIDEYDGEDLDDEYDGEDLGDKYDGEDLDDEYDGEDLDDEYDGEDLDESEAKSSNEIFSVSLKQMFIVLIVQPIEKKRVINNILQKRSRFELLENMKVYQLNRVMRNSVEIHKLVQLATDVLRKQQTVFIYQDNEKMKSKLKTSTWNESVFAINTVAKLRNSGPHITAKLPSRQRDTNQDLKEKLEFDQTKVVPASVRKTRYRNVFPKESPSIPKLGLDEAQAILGHVKGTDDGGVTDDGEVTNDGGVKTVSEFLFAAAEKTGHQISSKKPTFF